MKFSNDAMGIISSSRIGKGRKLEIGFEIQGSKANLLLSNAHMPRIQREGKDAWESEYINLDFDFINFRWLKH